MRRVPWWALLSSGCAPVVLIGGWVLAGLLRGPEYDPSRQTISSLAAHGAPDRWLVVAALAALGTCHLVTALGLRPASAAGRLALAGGGVASILAALFSEPHHGGSFRHGTVVAVGFALLCVWPFLAAGRSCSAPWALRLAPSILATMVMLIGVAWFLIAVRDHGEAGAAERAVTGVQALWPLIVTLSCVHAASPAPAREAGPPVRG